MPFFTSILTVGGLTLLLATILVVANRWLHVEEDPRVAKVYSLLPHTNCGGCGYPGCQPFAEALVAGQTEPGRCSVGTEEAQIAIASFLGVDRGASQRRVARLSCAGGRNVARNHARYIGLPTCSAATLVAGGGKGCFWGCLGLGDCDRACSFDAITMNPQHLPVVDPERCTACGDCVVACPKDLFSLESVDRHLWVACRSLEAGDQLLDECEVACTACGRCAADSPQFIHMDENLPVIDDPSFQAEPSAIARCPTGAIVWLDTGQSATKGGAATKVVRAEDRMDAST